MGGQLILLFICTLSRYAFQVLHWYLLFLAYQTGLSAVFSSARKSHLTHDSCALNDIVFNDVRENLWMTVCCQMTSLKIYEWTRKFIRYYKNIVYSLTHTLNLFVPIFIFKNDIQEKEIITSMDGNFRFLGDCFYSTTAEPQYCVNSPPRDWKIPSALVIGERLLYSLWYGLH